MWPSDTIWQQKSGSTLAQDGTKQFISDTNHKTRLRIAVLKWHPGLPGANELTEMNARISDCTCEHLKVTYNRVCHLAAIAGTWYLFQFVVKQAFGYLFYFIYSATLSRDRLLIQLILYLQLASKQCPTSHNMLWGVITLLSTSCLVAGDQQLMPGNQQAMPCTQKAWHWPSSLRIFLNQWEKF